MKMFQIRDLLFYDVCVRVWVDVCLGFLYVCVIQRADWS